MNGIDDPQHPPLTPKEQALLENMVADIAQRLKQAKAGRIVSVSLPSQKGDLQDEICPPATRD